MLKYYLLSLVLAAVGSKTIELDQHPDHTFKIESLSYQGKDKTGWLEIEDIEFDISQHHKLHKEEHEVKDDYYKMENGQLKTINKEWLFFKTDTNCSIQIHVYEWNSGDDQEHSLSCSEAENTTMTLTFEDRTYSIKYSLKALPKAERFFQLMYIWDISNPLEDLGELYLK